MIELMIGLFIATLVITPLMSLAVHLLETDRREQARNTSEEELQTALEYISRDLQQSIYIYDRDGLDEIADQLPVSNTSVDLTPILVFWKRKLVENAQPINSGVNENQCDGDDPDEDNCDNTFVYSLVGYYLVEGGSDIWSKTLRIGRFEIQDGVKRLDNGAYVSEGDSRIGRDDGFAAFDLSGDDTLREKMAAWEKVNENFNNFPQSNILLDFIDQSTGNNIPSENCPADSDPNDSDPEWQMIPNPNNIPSPGFSVCVFSSQNKARIFLRGNALARLRSRNDVPDYKDGASAFFPTAKLEVKGTGVLTGNQ